jgi:putative sterol carrier protein
LTAWGKELEPIILALGRWGARSPTRTPGVPLGVDSLVLSWRTMFSAERAADFSARIELDIDGHLYHASIAHGALRLARGADIDSDAALKADVATFVALVYEGARFTDAVRSGALTVRGDKLVAKRFLGLFPLPAMASSA